MATPDEFVEGPLVSSARELQLIVQAEREGAPFLVYRTPYGEQVLARFAPASGELTVGRSTEADISLAWDTEVSSVHAVLERLAGEVTLLDDGLSRNGSYVNGARVHGRRRLRDGDVLRFGRTAMLVRVPAGKKRRDTSGSRQPLAAVHLSEHQRKVLLALCVPQKPFSPPPTNQEIAEELGLSVSAVKAHLRALFDKFEVLDLPQNKKRHALVQAAVRSGLIPRA
jgi:pSer/pThr/pTyr-binding forkhead associated (FHA) protein